MPAVRVIITDWPTHQTQLSEVRARVFVEEQRVPVELELDELDAGAVHALALDGAKPVGTGRLLHDGRIGRMAVLPEYRGRGVGAALLKALVAAAADCGHRQITLHAQTHAIAFYEKLGFRAYGEEFDDAGIPHRAMRRGLPD